MTDATSPARRTRQRLAVSSIMATLDDFRTAQEVHDELRRRGEPVGLATVYRCLQAMTDAGEADMVRTADGQASYRRCSAGHHHHLICRACGRTVEVSLPDFENWVRAISAQHGFTDLDHELEFFGRCGDCAGQRNGPG